MSKQPSLPQSPSGEDGETQSLVGASQPVSSRVKRGRPVNPALHATILHAAGDLFIEHGYQTTTMDKVAQAAGVSKLTLYKRFPNKDALFSEMIQAKCLEFAPESLFRDATGTVEQRLLAIGKGLLKLLISEDARCLEAMIMADSMNHLHLKRLFFNAGPARFMHAIANCLRGLDAAQDLSVPDPDTSARLFAALFKGSDLVMLSAVNPDGPPSDAAIDTYCRQATQMFIAGHCHAGGRQVL